MSEQKGQTFVRSHNHSNITFNDSFHPTPHAYQPSYRSMSQVGKLMTDRLEAEIPSKLVYHYHNRIAQVQKDYSLPQANDPHFEKNNHRFEEFFEKAGKFTKPYDDYTKYSDNLMKNRQLLRRGQFDLPTHPFTGPVLAQNNRNTKSYSNTHTTFLRGSKTSVLKTTNPAAGHNLLSRTGENMRKRKPSSDGKNGFDKTLKYQARTYHTMINLEKLNKDDEVRFKNSMNRILAAEMICFKMQDKGERVKPLTLRIDDKADQ